MKFIYTWSTLIVVFIFWGCSNERIAHNSYIDFIFPQPVDSIMTAYYDIIARDKKLLNKQIIEWNPHTGWESYIFLTVNDRKELNKKGEIQNQLLYIKNRTNRFFVIGNKYKIPIYVGCIDGICAYGNRKYPLPSADITYDLAPVMHLFNDSIQSNWKIIKSDSGNYIQVTGIFLDQVLKWNSSKYR